MTQPPAEPAVDYAALGNRDLLGGRKLALFCSVKCPGKLILRTYDLGIYSRRGDGAEGLDQVVAALAGSQWDTLPGSARPADRRSRATGHHNRHTRSADTPPPGRARCAADWS